MTLVVNASTRSGFSAIVLEGQYNLVGGFDLVDNERRGVRSGAEQQGSTGGRRRWRSKSTSQSFKQSCQEVSAYEYNIEL